MEKIVYSERIRELADILARKLVVRKAKNLWATHLTERLRPSKLLLEKMIEIGRFIA